MTDIDPTTADTGEPIVSAEPTALEWQEDPAATGDISAPPASSRGLGGLLLAAMLPVVLQAVVGALLLRALLDDPAAVAESTRLLGAVGLGALIVAALVAWTVGRRAPTAAPIDPVLRVVEEDEASDWSDAVRVVEAERDLLRRRVEMLEASVAETASVIRSGAQPSSFTAPPAPNADLVDSAGRLANGARAAASATHSVLEAIVNSPSTTSSEPEAAAVADDPEAVADAIERLEVLAAETRLLALNAAIEASGIGDEGTRFAVVADEVRKLADEARTTARRLAAWVRPGDAETDAVPRPAPDSGLVESAHEAARSAAAVVELAAAHVAAIHDQPPSPVGSPDFGYDAATLEQLADRLDHILAAGAMPAAVG